MGNATIHSISFEDELWDEIDNRAKKEKLDRSKLMRKGIKIYLDGKKIKRPSMTIIGLYLLLALVVVLVVKLNL